MNLPDEPFIPHDKELIREYQRLVGADEPVGRADKQPVGTDE